VSPRPRVLCAEPSADVCSLLHTLLDQNGFDSDSASTISEAVGKAGAGDYCLYNVEDGYADGANVELIRRLRASMPHVPVLVYSSLSFESSRRRRRAPGRSPTSSGRGRSTASPTPSSGCAAAPELTQACAADCSRTCAALASPLRGIALRGAAWAREFVAKSRARLFTVWAFCKESQEYGAGKKGKKRLPCPSFCVSKCRNVKSPPTVLFVHNRD
jgi:CheY-like chemotaxis protein